VIDGVIKNQLVIYKIKKGIKTMKEIKEKEERMRWRQEHREQTKKN
jgi:hypothetical protein